MTLEKINKIKERNEKAHKKNEEAYMWGGPSRYLSAARRNEELIEICKLATCNLTLAKRAENALASGNIYEQQKILREMIAKTKGVSSY